MCQALDVAIEHGYFYVAPIFDLRTGKPSRDMITVLATKETPSGRISLDMKKQPLALNFCPGCGKAMIEGVPTC